MEGSVNTKGVKDRSMMSTSHRPTYAKWKPPSPDRHNANFDGPIFDELKKWKAGCSKLCKISFAQNKRKKSYTKFRGPVYSFDDRSCPTTSISDPCRGFGWPHTKLFSLHLS